MATACITSADCGFLQECRQTPSSSSSSLPSLFQCTCPQDFYGYTADCVTPTWGTVAVLGYLFTSLLFNLFLIVPLSRATARGMHPGHSKESKTLSYLANILLVFSCLFYALYCVLSITTALLHRRQGPMVLALTLFAALCELSLSASVGIMGLTFLSIGRKILSISPFAHSFSRVLFLVLSISLALALSSAFLDFGIRMALSVVAVYWAFCVTLHLCAGIRISSLMRHQIVTGQVLTPTSRARLCNSISSCVKCVFFATLARFLGTLPFWLGLFPGLHIIDASFMVIRVVIIWAIAKVNTQEPAPVPPLLQEPQLGQLPQEANVCMALECPGEELAMVEEGIEENRDEEMKTPIHDADFLHPLSGLENARRHVLRVLALIPLSRLSTIIESGESRRTSTSVARSLTKRVFSSERHSKVDLDRTSRSTGKR